MSDIQEEIKKAHRKALEQDFNEIIKELKQEEHKNLELSMKINKAIEYINEGINNENWVDDNFNEIYAPHLLNILQGKEK